MLGDERADSRDSRHSFALFEFNLCVAETECVYGDCLPTLAHSPPFVRGVRLHAFDKRFIFADALRDNTKNVTTLVLGRGR